jgi:LPS export ABC transporter protein LptC
LPLKSISKKIKYFISAVIISLIGIVVAVFVSNRIYIDSIQKPLPPQQTTATLSIQNFRHTATQDGHKEWSVEADSANLFSNQNIAELSKISASFFLKNDETILLTADNGLLHIDTNNMAVSGHIIIKFLEYVMTTENLNYIHSSHIISITTPVMVTGNSIMLKANTMTYNLITDIIECSGNVEGTFKQITGL